MENKAERSKRKLAARNTNISRPLTAAWLARFRLPALDQLIKSMIVLEMLPISLKDPFSGKSVKQLKVVMRHGSCWLYGK